MSTLSLIPRFIEEFEELLRKWEVNRFDFEWDGGELNSLITKIDNIIQDYWSSTIKEAKI